MYFVILVRIRRVGIVLPELRQNEFAISDRHCGGVPFMHTVIHCFERGH